MKSPHKEKRTWLKFGDTLSDTLHDARSFMAQHHREDSLGVRAAQCVGVSVTNPCGHNLKNKCSDSAFQIATFQK